MTFIDLIKATVMFGGAAFVIYRFPVVGQILVLVLLGLVWLAYAHSTLTYLRRR